MHNIPHLKELSIWKYPSIVKVPIVVVVVWVGNENGLGGVAIMQIFSLITQTLQVSC